MELLDLVETFRAEEASFERIWGGEGRRVGYRRDQDPRYMRKLAEAAMLLKSVSESPKRNAWKLQEALTTSDFPLLFGDIIDRQLLANYKETVPTYRNYMRISPVADFRTVKRFAINGAESTLAKVDENAPYPQTKLSDLAYQYSVQKYGRTIPLSWETLIDDDLHALQDIPARFGIAARRSEEFFATGLFMDVNGPNAAFFNTANKNQVTIANGATTNNPALSIQGLQDAFTVLGNQRDADGQPILIDAVELVVPQSLMVTAENIMHATELRLNAAGGGTNEQIVTVNWMKNRVHLNVNAYMPIVASTANGGTSWMMVASPNGQRPAFEMGFLRGHETPEVFMKSPNMTRVGGGAGTAQDGDFETDTFQYKVRTVFGGVMEDFRMAVASNGSGA